MATVTSPRAQSPAGSNSSTPRVTTSSASGSGTPTSSIRPSIDLNRAAPPNPPNASTFQAQRRNRAALRDYYNLKAKPNAVAAAETGTLSRSASIVSSTSVASDSTYATANTLTNDADGSTSALTAQLDSPSFDADTWLNDLMKTSTLRDILRTEAVLVSEIRNLDGERKALVYDNYSKLIKAVGTIGEMQKGLQQGGGLDGVEALGPKLNGLQVTVNEIVGGRGGKTGTGNQEQRRARQDKGKRELVRWVVAAPGRLSELIQEGKTDEAQEEWEVVRGYLEAWIKENVKGASEVMKACEDVVDLGENEGEAVH